jgi:hypothetical protein
MAANTYTSYSQKNAAEDVDSIITNIDPTEVPLFSSLSKRKATNRKVEWLSDGIRESNPLNSVAEGSDSVDTPLTSPVRRYNYVQEFQGVVNVSDIANLVDTIGYKQELGYKVGLEGKAMKLDIEAAIVGNHASRPGIAGVEGGLFAGMESWITTAESHGTGGAAGGFDENTHLVAAPTDGALRDLTEELLLDTLQKSHEAGGKPSKIIVPANLKRAISRFSGDAVRNMETKDRKVTNTVSIIEGDFGIYEVMYHNKVRSRTVIAYDPDLWELAVMQGFQTKDLPANGSYQRKLINWVGSLVCKNEKGNAKIADVQRAAD